MLRTQQKDTGWSSTQTSQSGSPMLAEIRSSYSQRSETGPPDAFVGHSRVQESNPEEQNAWAPVTYLLCLFSESPGTT